MRLRRLGPLPVFFFSFTITLHAQQTQTPKANDGAKTPESQSFAGKAAAALPSGVSRSGSNPAAERPAEIAGHPNSPAPPPGIMNFIPIWTTALAQGDSVIFQQPGTNNIGVNTITPAGTLDARATTAGEHLFQFGSAGANDGNSIRVFNGAATPFTETFIQGAISLLPPHSFVPGAFPGDGGLRVAPGARIFFGDSGTQRMVLGPQGHVGIGTPSPGSPLDVRGPGNGLTGIVNVTQTNNAFGVGLSVNAGASGSGINVVNAVNGIVARASIIGLFGVGGGFGAGVFGENDVDSNFTSAVIGFESGPTATNTAGVRGVSASPLGVGVLGTAVGTSALAATGFHGPAGVWGDASGTAAGVLGTTDNGIALNGFNNSAAGFPTLNLVNTETSSASPSALVLLTRSAFGGFCAIDVLGNLRCTGSKSAVVPVEGNTRRVSLYAVEATENWFEDAGSGHLSNGSSIIPLEPVFVQTINTSVDYHVFLTPTGECKGLFVAEKTPKSFTVRELGAGTSNVGFDYRIMARREGYENVRLEEMKEQLEEIASRASLSQPKKGEQGGVPPIPKAPKLMEEK